jgi:Uma2 family endonuclease
MVEAVKPSYELQEQHILLNVDWAGYIGIGDILLDQPVRMTYSQGTLELRTLCFAHARAQKVLDRLFFTCAMGMHLDILSGGSTTLRSQRLDCGLEPDECYWIKNERRMRGKKSFDIEFDPPPDLVLEIEFPHSKMNRMKILAALGVPEVWRFDGQVLQVLMLDSQAKYQPATESAVAPNMPIHEMARFLLMRDTMGDTALLRRFQDRIVNEGECHAEP